LRFGGEKEFMKLSEKWLREWVSPRIDTEALAHCLTMAGLEVSALEPAAPEYKHIVVGEIVSIEPHPSMERLKLCRVNVGKNKPLSVVCGAANAVVGLKTPAALPGAVLADGTIIARTEIHGVTSNGMLCSGQELGLEEASTGLYVLEKPAKAGTPLAEYLVLPDGVLEIDLTPNRGDCLSIAGIARELAALTGAKVRAPIIRNVPSRSRRRFDVALKAAQDCPHYVGRVIEGIDPQAATPAWMKERLRRGGVRSLHPVVDVTNYVMLELGQPMHAFDLDKLTGAIRVRASAKGERLVLLDGNEIPLEPGSLVIADANGPIALAGIMGGLASAVNSDTRRVFLESAYFRPQSIGGRARALGLQSESSYRFERGVDPGLQKLAIERATSLLLKITGGIPGPVLERIAKRYIPKPSPIRLRTERVERLLGLKLSVSRIEAILKRLGMRTVKVSNGLRAMPPSYRFDLEREADLIEEIARIHGYESVPEQLPRFTMPLPSQTETCISEPRLRRMLVDRDYQEVITYSFVDPIIQSVLDPQTHPAMLANPISAEMAAMRTTLWPGLVQAILYNQNRQQSRVRLFEIGRRFLPSEKAVVEQKVLAGAVSGPALAVQWGERTRAADFYDAKGDLEALFDLTGNAQEYCFESIVHPVLHPGRSAVIRHLKRPIGLVGVLHPNIQAKLQLDHSVILFEVDLLAILRAKIPKFRETSKYPAIRRDLAVVVECNTSAQAVLDCVSKVAGNLLVNLELFDEYRGEGIDSGRKSLALALTLQHSSRTLKEDEVEALIAHVITALASDLQAELRH